MTRGRFLVTGDLPAEPVPFGTTRWLSRPTTTAAANLAVVEVTLVPGQGHAFHLHPNQEEVIYVLAGEVEQWLERERRTLRPGDGIFIGKGVVHASFNTGAGPARLLAILSPCVGEGGYEVVEVAHEAPWRELR